MSAAGDTYLGASDANGSVVLEGGSAVLGAAPTVSFAAATEGLSSRGTVKIGHGACAVHSPAPVGSVFFVQPTLFSAPPKAFF